MAGGLVVAAVTCVVAPAAAIVAQGIQAATCRTATVTLDAKLNATLINAPAVLCEWQETGAGYRAHAAPPTTLWAKASGHARASVGG